MIDSRIGGEARKKLLSVLTTMPQSIFTRISLTVASDEPIATGTWIARIGPHKTPCGCLLFDGYGREHDLDAVDTDYFSELLAEFYGEEWYEEWGLYESTCHKYTDAEALVIAYDEWARWNRFRRNDLLTAAGRTELRGIFAEAAAERGLVTGA